MKGKMFLLILLFTKQCCSQKLVLINREFAWKSYLSDTITSKLAKEYLPFYVDEFDSLCIKVEPLWNTSKLGMSNTYLDEKDFSTGHITFKILSVAGTYGGKYDILLISQIGDQKFNFRLSNPERDASVNKSVIQGFIKYLRKTRKQIHAGELKVKSI